ncbi:DUF4184 family protein [Dactylosporangium sp. NPDC000555]|uniref:DUF4184 family protein n=1 Tax=Dactylosporangium sp. NPDC000555 TaxID=3154260 RepID=UPI0033286F61
MPSTLPTHPLAVLPLKLWRPRWFDGVALATGACAPDYAYALDGTGVRIHSHTVAAVVWWSLPCAVATAWLIRRGAPVVAAHLPGWLREYGVLGRVRHAWFVTALSAVLGAASHLLWDLVTHPGPVAAWWAIRQASDGAALVLMPLLLWYCGRRHLLRQWHGDPPPVPRRPVLFWGATAAITAAGVLLTWALGDHSLAWPWFGYPEHVHVLGVRLIVAGTVGPLAGALAVQSANVLADRTAAAAPVPRR